MKFLAALALLAGLAGAQSTPLTGVWKVLETTTTGPNGKTTLTQPGLLIFAGRYYSVVRDLSATPRPDITEKTTDADWRASRRLVQAQSGTYEVSASTLTTHPMVAASPNNMHADSAFTQLFKLEGDTLLLTEISTKTGPVANPGTTKYKRVE
jgi:hypothetical protein